MELIEGLRTRKSIRKFLDRRVEKNLIAEILSDAHWAPSASNQQPWQFWVVTGEVLTGLTAAIMNAHQEKKKSYDPSKNKTIPACYVERTKNLFRELRPFISRLGDENKGFIESGSYRFYDAPVVIFISMNRKMPGSRLMDIGMAAENLMLSAHARGLGTCAIALTLLYADVISSHLSIGDEDALFLSIALGFPDPEFPVNTFRASREKTDDVIRWMGC